METIRTYVDNMFAVIPDSEQARRIKSDLLDTMEDKYNELKAAGKSENEAVGAVISDFGNIDELKGELGSVVPAEESEEDDEENVIVVTGDEADSFIRTVRCDSLMIAIGVALCILAFAGIIALDAFTGAGRVSGGLMDVLRPLILFMPIITAVVLFIVSGISLSRYDDYEKLYVKMDDDSTSRMAEKAKNYRPCFTAMIATGVALCIVAVMFVGVFDSLLIVGLGTAVMLTIIAAGVFLLVLAGIRDDNYHKLLNDGDYAKKKAKRRARGGKSAKSDKVFEAVMGAVWPITVAGYLIWSFTTHNWGFTWIVFPVVGILSGALEAILKATVKDDK